MEINALPGSDMTFEEWVAHHNLVIEANERGGSRPGDPMRWYVHFELCHVSEGFCLVGMYGNGSTPEQALAAYLPKIAGRTIVLDAFRPTRREIRCPNEWKQP